jgi:dTDP-4-dehydrorhamnose 3,5-epimerase
MPDTSHIQPVKDCQTVTRTGESVEPRIAGLIIRRAAPIEDERGEIVEVYRPAWEVHPAPLVYVYQCSVRPGAAKGWILHRENEDRLFMSRGVMRWAFFDNRQNSPTYRMLNTFVFTERNRALVVIPKGVFHAVKNIGQEEAVFVNMPTVAYNHADPDKYRLPLKNDLIPFAFDDEPGW